MNRELHVHDLSSDVTVASFRSVLLAHCRGATPAAVVDKFRAAYSAVTLEHPKVVFLAIIETTSHAPNEEARRVFLRFFEDHGAQLACVVFVYRGQGFRGAFVRSIVAGMLDLMPRARVPFPRHVVGSVEEAVVMARKYLPDLDGPALLAAARELCELKAPA